MNGNRLLLDTNIILYLLGGDQTLAQLLEGKIPHISFISELELYGFKKLTKSERGKIDGLLDQCTIIDINAGIKVKAIEIRQNQGLKLPDCIIAGTALYLDIPLFSSDKDFSKIDNLNLLSYQK